MLKYPYVIDLKCFLQIEDASCKLLVGTFSEYCAPQNFVDIFITTASKPVTVAADCRHATQLRCIGVWRYVALPL